MVWEESALDSRLRDKFFPNETQRTELNYVVIREGRIETRRTLLRSDEGKSNFVALLPRFHATPDGRLFVFFYAEGGRSGSKQISERRRLRIHRHAPAG